MDAAQVVDLVDVAKALPRRGRCFGVVVGAPDIDALRRAHAGTQLTADALLHTVLVPVEDMATVESVGLGALLVGLALLEALATAVITGHTVFEELLERDAEALEVGTVSHGHPPSLRCARCGHCGSRGSTCRREPRTRPQDPHRGRRTGRCSSPRHGRSG